VLNIAPRWNNQDALALRLLVVLVETSGLQGYLGHITLSYGEIDPRFASNWGQVVQACLQSKVVFRECGQRANKLLESKEFARLRWAPQVCTNEKCESKVVSNISRFGLITRLFLHTVSEVMGDLNLSLFGEGRFREKLEFHMSIDSMIVQTAAGAAAAGAAATVAGATPAETPPPQRRHRRRRRHHR